MARPPLVAVRTYTLKENFPIGAMQAATGRGAAAAGTIAPLPGHWSEPTTPRNLIYSIDPPGLFSPGPSVSLAQGRRGCFAEPEGRRK